MLTVKKRRGLPNALDHRQVIELDRAEKNQRKRIKQILEHRFGKIKEPPIARRGERTCSWENNNVIVSFKRLSVYFVYKPIAEEAEFFEYK